ncbi:MAG: saccharopine dehydrogenase [Desulfobacteraceae bacterium]|nr:MAG: saccharopine dehydrogenase [Desulfobacteraceae bacterium]
MKIAVLGGLGLQGRAALLDLARSRRVDEVICADIDLKDWEKAAAFIDVSKIRPIRLDGASKEAMAALLKQGVDAAIDLLPLPLMRTAFEAALEAKVPLVSTNYGTPIRHLHEAAGEAGIGMMPECGLDPGIDLVICGNAVRRFDQLHVLNSYCGGIPEKKACNNPLNYKISWNFDMMLRSQKRASTFIRNGGKYTVPAELQHESEMIHTVVFPGLGELEAVPNGDAVFYTDLLNVSTTVREAGRYSLRWPGWCAFWGPIKRLGLLADEPIKGFDGAITPHRLMEEILEPRLQYLDDEKDVAAMYNVFSGIRDGRPKTVKISLMIERDLKSGLFGMNLGVGFPASIVAQMLASGGIAANGVLNPALDVPYAPFMTELEKRGIVVKEEEGS